MPLTIGIDARELEFHPRGVGRVLICLLKEWNKNTRGHQFVLYFKNHVPDLEAINYPHYKKRTLPVPWVIRRNRVWEQIFLPYYIKKDRLDVFFSPSYTLPLAASCPTAVLIHDISYQAHPELFNLRDQLLLRLFTRLSARMATRIVCCSNYTRSEVLAHYGAQSKSKTSVIYSAPDERFFAGGNADDSVIRRYNVAQPYFLFVGSLLRRRNISQLLQAFRKIAEKHPQYRLVLIGNNPEMGGEFQLLINRLALGERVVHLDYVQEEDLAPIYRRAFCLVHPSSYEGFALPVVEAMACGAPAIIVDAGAMVEVADNAALVTSLESLPQAMTAFVENPALREELARKGLARARKLSWRETASAYLNVIEEAANRL